MVLYKGSQPYSYSPYVEMEANVTSQNASSNYSTVEIKMYFVVPTGSHISWTAYNTPCYIKSTPGPTRNFTWNKTLTSIGRYHIRTESFNVYHNSDGTGSASLRAQIENMGLTWSGYPINSLTVTGTLTLPTIGSASTLNSVAMHYTLQGGTSNYLDIDLVRKSTSYTHDIVMKYGNTTIATWYDVGVPSTLDLTASQINTLLNAMPTVASGTATLYVDTLNGANQIGATITKNFTVNVHSSVVPTISSPLFKSEGTIRSTGSGTTELTNFIQGVSKVFATASCSAIGGATLKSGTIYVEKQITGENKQVFGSLVGNTLSGTSSVLTGYGMHKVVFELVDSRNRKTTYEGVFNLEQYTRPEIVSFTASRPVEAPDNVKLEFTFTWDKSFGNSVKCTIYNTTLDSMILNTTRSSTVPTPFNGVYTDTSTVKGNAYDYSLVVTDSFGEVYSGGGGGLDGSSSSTISTGTANVLMSINKDDGIGFGKHHEKGFIDMFGDMYIDGTLFVNDIVTGVTEGTTLIDGVGSSSTGAYLKFSNGILVCWIRELAVPYLDGTLLQKEWTYPHPFVQTPIAKPPAVFVSKNEYKGAVNVNNATVGAKSLATSSTVYMFKNTADADFASNYIVYLNVMAIGWWK